MLMIITVRNNTDNNSNAFNGGDDKSINERDWRI